MKNFFLILVLFSLNSLQAQKIASKKVFTNDSVYISLENPFLAPVELSISKKKVIKEEFRFKKKVVFAPREVIIDVFVLPLAMVKDTSSIDVNNFFEINGSLGNSKRAKHNEDYRYALPYQKRKSFKIIQSFNGKFSHSKRHSRYAIDFGLQIGDTITAAREGLVIIVKEDSKEHGRTPDFSDKGNKIVVMHDDGTFANYVHLDFNGALVAVGDKIRVGQAIGISGLTGFTTLPHLHFVVLEPGNKSVPIYFKDIGRKKLKPGKRYNRR